MTDEKLEQLVQRLDPKWKLVRSWPLIGGLSAQMTALEVALPDGSQRVIILRQSSDYDDYDDHEISLNLQVASREFRTLQVLNSAGLPTAKPYLVDESREFLATPYLVIEYIEGSADYAPADTTNIVTQAAATLAQIHSLDSTKLDLSFLPTQTGNIVDRFGPRPTNLETASLEGRIRDVLETIGTIPQANPPSFLHGDFWPGNLLWRDGRLVAVIDWEDAKVGDPLSDFAISRFDMTLYFGSDALHQFTRQYQSTMHKLDYSYLPYWDLCAALRAAPNVAAWSTAFPSVGRHDLNEATMRASLDYFVGQALNKVAAL